MRRSLVAAALISSLVALSACGGTVGESPSAAATPTESPEATASAVESAEATPLAGSGLLGTFRTTIGANEFNTPVGDWQLRIDEQGIAFVAPDGFEFSPGDVIAVTATEITFAHDPECPTQEGDATEGRYGWTFDGAELVFTEIEDSCRDRAHLLTQAPWQVMP